MKSGIKKFLVKKITLVVVTSCLFMASTMTPQNKLMAQQQEGQESAQTSGGGDVLDNTLSDLYLIAALGAGGAILGLSTLSFVDKPTKHLKNIWVGGAIGIIVGVGVVAWKQATKSKDSFQSAYLDETSQLLSHNTQNDWRKSDWSIDLSPTKSGDQNELSPLGFAWSFEF